MQLPGRAKHVPRVWPKADAHQSRSWNRGGEHARQSPVICYRAHAARSPIVTLADESACVAPRAGTRPACIQLETEQVCRDSMNLCITGARLCGFRTRGRAGDCLVLLSPHRPRAERLDSHRSPVTGQHSRRTLSNTTTYTPHDPPPPSQAGADAGRRDYVAMVANYASLKYVDRCAYTAVCAGTGHRLTYYQV